MSYYFYLHWKSPAAIHTSHLLICSCLYFPYARRFPSLITYLYNHIRDFFSILTFLILPLQASLLLLSLFSFFPFPFPFLPLFLPLFLPSSLPALSSPRFALIANSISMLSEESLAFHYAVYDVICKIPPGHVCTYGHVAYLAGKPSNARQVGLALKNCFNVISVFQQSEPAVFSGLPWWRVLTSSGIIAVRDHGEHEQKRRLLEENVDVRGMSVSLDQYGWFPDDV